MSELVDEQTIERFRPDGYAVLRKAFDPSELSAELDDALKHGLRAGSAAPAPGARVLATTPGDLVVFDEHLTRQRRGRVRRQWRVDFMADPINSEGTALVHATFARLVDPGWDGGDDVDRYPSYGCHWQTRDRPWTERLGTLGIYDLAAGRASAVRAQPTRAAQHPERRHALGDDRILVALATVLGDVVARVELYGTVTNTHENAQAVPASTAARDEVRREVVRRPRMDQHRDPREDRRGAGSRVRHVVGRRARAAASRRSSRQMRQRQFYDATL